MAGKQEVEGGNRVLTGLVGLAAAYIARQVIQFVWKRITGKEPPEHPDDPETALGEALAWGILVGVGMQTARMLATRATVRKTSVHEGSAE
jgi:predicted anti-sigma-YlaC factor YlaD